jgi:hypothetical protein
MTRTNRTERAVAIRDHLLPLIRVQGAMEEIGGLRMVTWKAGRFAFALRSPFTAWGIKASPPGSYSAALAKQRANPVLPWGLDVWHGRKVLSLQWDDAGRVEVISFTRGPWEDEALALGPGQNLDPK